jgi:hypothetical protein
MNISKIAQTNKNINKLATYLGYKRILSPIANSTNSIQDHQA